MLSSDPTEMLSDEPLLYGTQSRGNVYKYIGMEIAIPDEEDKNPPVSKIVIANVTRDLIPLARSVSSPPKVTIEAVLSSDLDSVEFSIPQMDMVNVQYDASQLTFSLAIDSLSTEPYPSGAFDPAKFPRLVLLSMFDSFIGLPYVDGGRSFAGVDCWGLVWLVHHEVRGVELPSFHERYTLPADRKVIDGIVAGTLDAFDEIAAGQEQPFDAVLMRDAGRVCHVGLVVRPGRLLHIERGHTSQIENYRTGLIKSRVVGFYRFKG